MRRGLNQLLAAVSRSFYLTIRVLPPSLRHPVGLAYLLARMSDTVADSANASTEIRLQLLQEMAGALRGSGPMPDFSALVEVTAAPAERVLLQQAGELMALLEASPVPDREEIVRVLEEILRGQRLDVTRFGAGGCGRIAALATTAELEDYTYSVAGCVGEFWTRICSRHLPRYAPGVDLEPLVQWGVSFGKGLQLVNILRDAPVDLAQGRCYFPDEERDGLPPEAWQADPALARAFYHRWTERAEGHLADGLRYIEAIRPWRLRLACFLPWALGVRTLQLLRATPPLEVAGRVKVPRSEVRRLFCWGIWAAMAHRNLRQAVKRVQGTTENVLR